MSKLHKNQLGLTLVELLATIIILSLISIFSFSILKKSLETRDNIQIENNLRDEADLIMSEFVRSIYSTKNKNIIGDPVNNAYINFSNDPTKCQEDKVNSQDCKNTFKPIGFKEENGVIKVHLKDKTYTVSNNKVKILPKSTIKRTTDTKIKKTIYSINLYLEIEKKYGDKIQKKELGFESTIPTIE